MAHKAATPLQGNSYLRRGVWKERKVRNSSFLYLKRKVDWGKKGHARVNFPLSFEKGGRGRLGGKGGQPWEKKREFAAFNEEWKRGRKMSRKKLSL